MIAARVAWALLRVVRCRRSELRRQRALVSVCGRQSPSLDAVVVDADRPAAYCVAGRDRAVIVTRGAVDLLPSAQLAAVLAHERAHLDARHHRRLAAAELLGAALPALPFLRALPGAVRRLLEMHADDLAARECDPELLARALVTMASARPVRDRSVALAAADTDAAARIARMLGPSAGPAGRRHRSLRAAVVAVALAPLVVALTPAAVAVNQPPVRPSAVSASAHATSTSVRPASRS